MIIKTQKSTTKGRSGVRKYGRNLEKCKRYKNSGQREKNKARELVKREKKFAKRKKKRDKNIHVSKKTT